jgi:hypothetical protein
MIIFLYTFISVITIELIIFIAKKIINDRQKFFNDFTKFANKIFEFCKIIISKLVKFLNIAILLYFLIFYFLINGKLKNFIKLFTNDVDSINTLAIRYFECIKNYVLIYIAVIIIIICLRKAYAIIKRLIQRKENKKQFKNKDSDNVTEALYSNMYNYFNNKEENMPILVTGRWGSGKTYTVDNFFKKYYKYENVKVYKISCFGITTKENLMEMIKEICENEDNGLFNKTMEIIEKIPIFGEFLRKVLEREYDINSIKQGSIFIFDDFERIEKYDKNNSFHAISKYNIVSGVINELIEIYKMRVLIICNEDELPSSYVYENFIYKLECRKFEIKPSEVILKVVWNQIVKKQLNIVKYQKQFDDIFNKIESDVEKLWHLSDNKNIRILHKTIYNYVNFMLSLYESEYEFDKKANEEIGIFYTNLIVNLYANRYSVLKELSNCINLCAYASEFNNNDDDNKISHIKSVLENINAICLYKEKERNLWMNLEQNHDKIKNSIENALVEYRIDSTDR